MLSLYWIAQILHWNLITFYRMATCCIVLWKLHANLLQKPNFDLENGCACVILIFKTNAKMIKSARSNLLLFVIRSDSLEFCELKKHLLTSSLPPINMDWFKEKKETYQFSYGKMLKNIKYLFCFTWPIFLLKNVLLEYWSTVNLRRVSEQVKWKGITRPKCNDYLENMNECIVHSERLNG